MRWNQPHRPHHPTELRGRDAPASTGWVRNAGLEAVRQAMLSSLASASGCEVARMSMRLRYAADIEALWYLRNDLFSTLAALRGEPDASAVLTEVTPLFQGLLPQTLLPHLPAGH